MKKIPRNLAGGTVSTGNTISGCTHASEKRTSTIWAFGEEEGYIAKKIEGTYPCLLLSMSRGATARMYVQVQMSRSKTRRRDWKLKSAD
jgi:hypothetical protein